jgi:outer membrane protein assembly factor BamB
MRYKIALLIACIQMFLGSPLSADNNWPQFRGRQASGVGSGRPPKRWNLETGKNVAWKTELLGLGHSGPIVWGDRVIITTAINSLNERPSLAMGWSGGAGEAAEETGEWSWRVICLDLKSGKQIWSTDATTGKPTIKRHIKGSHANCTPATDGKHIVAFFGSEGLYCFDMDGNLKWKKDYGRLHSGPYDSDDLEWGFASSPVIHDGKVVLQCDCLNANFISIVDLGTGEEVRRIEREDVATWSTPLIVSDDKRTQIVCNGFKQMAGFDFNSGELLWSIEGGGDVPVPSPLFSHGMIYLTNGHGRTPTYALSPKASGDLTPGNSREDPAAEEKPAEENPVEEQDEKEQGQEQENEGAEDDEKEFDKPSAGLAWWQPRDGSYIPTPVIYKDLLYTCNDNGRLAVRNALTGELVFRQRVGNGRSTFTSSAVAANDHVYITNEDGETTVIKYGQQYQEVTVNKLNETTMATPAISGSRLLIRTERHLYCLAKTKGKTKIKAKSPVPTETQRQ